MRVKFLVVVNPTADDGKANLIWHNVKQQLDKQNIPYDYRVSKYKYHTTLITEQLIKASLVHPHFKYILLVVGGDATINEVITSASITVQSSSQFIPLAIIPAGHNNNFAIQNHISTDWQSALDHVISCQQAKELPIGQYTDRDSGKQHFFLNNFEVGIGSDYLNELKVKKSRFKLIQKWRSLMALIITLYNLETFSIHIDLNNKQRMFFNNTVGVLIQRNLLWNNNHPIMKQSKIPDDRFQIIILEKKNFPIMVLNLLALIMGYRPKSKKVHYYQANQIRLNDSTLKYGDVDCNVIGSGFFNIDCQVINYPFWI